MRKENEIANNLLINNLLLTQIFSKPKIQLWASFQFSTPIFNVFIHLTLNATRFQSLKFKPAFYLSLLISIQCLINSVYHEFLSLFIETTTYMQGAWLKYSFFLPGSFFNTQHVAWCLFPTYFNLYASFQSVLYSTEATENLLNGILFPKLF